VKTRSRTTLDVAKQVAVRLDATHVIVDEKAKKEIAKDRRAIERRSKPASSLQKASGVGRARMVLRELADGRASRGEDLPANPYRAQGGTVSER